MERTCSSSSSGVCSASLLDFSNASWSMIKLVVSCDILYSLVLILHGRHLLLWFAEAGGRGSSGVILEGPPGLLANPDVYI